MLKKIMISLTLLIGGLSFGQSFPYPLDVAIGQRWVGTSEAAFYGGVRTYLPLDLELFGVQPYAIPELGIDRDTLQPYARLELNLDSEYATAAAFVTRMGDSTRINLEVRFCVLSPACGQ